MGKNIITVDVIAPAKKLFSHTAVLDNSGLLDDADFCFQTFPHNKGLDTGHPLRHLANRDHKQSYKIQNKVDNYAVITNVDTHQMCQVKIRLKYIMLLKLPS